MESTLAQDYAFISGAVGHYLGIGRGSANSEPAWDDPTTRDINEILVAGQHNFYFPPILPGDHSSYEWSFIKPVVQLTLAAGASTVDLPDAFFGFASTVTMPSPDGTGSFLEVPVGNVGMILAKQTEWPNLSGWPRLVATNPLQRTDQTVGQRFQLMVWPTADVDYTLQFQMQWLPESLSADRPFPYGGAAHGETMKAACIAAAELHKDDDRGNRWQYFMEQLAKSVSIDRRMKARNIGENCDFSDHIPILRFPFTTTTFNGVNPDS